MSLLSKRCFALLLSVAVILTPFQGAMAGFGSSSMSGGMPSEMSAMRGAHQMPQQQACGDESHDCCQQQADMSCLSHCGSHFAPAIITSLPALRSTTSHIRIVTLPDLYTVQLLSELYRPPRG